MQVASIGLLKAIDRFDPERGVDFSSYAIPTILGELKRHFRDCGWGMHLARSEKERVLAVRNANDRLSGELGRSPSPEEVAEATGMSVEDVFSAFVASTAARPSSLEAVTAEDAEGRGGESDELGFEDRGLALVESRDTISRSLRCLSPRERQVLYLRFVEDLTQTEIGKRIGLSQMQVSRIVRAALERSRELPDQAASEEAALKSSYGPSERRAALARSCAVAEQPAVLASTAGTLSSLPQPA